MNLDYWVALLGCVIVGIIWGSCNYLMAKVARKADEPTNKSVISFVKYLVKNWRIILLSALDKSSSVIMIISTRYLRKLNSCEFGISFIKWY